jgi:competence protein ComEC
VSSGIDLRADVLKVPHHGSSDADPEFLAASGARVALVSVGADNTYGHPTARTLTWLTGDGMRVHRTDREGDLAVVGSAGSWGVAPRGGPSVGAADLPYDGRPDDPAAVVAETPGATRAALRRGRSVVPP